MVRKRGIVTAFIILLSGTVSGQGSSIKNLVFEGAGIRGIAYCGAIRELESKGLLAGIEKVGGTSAGAVTALCISLGYTSEEITELLYSTNFKKFNDGKFLFPGGINRMNKYFGWYRGEKLSKWLEKIIQKKAGTENLTFEELYNKGFKDLYVTATILNQQKLIVLSRYTYPRMRVKDAVRISMSIPFYFEAPFLDTGGRLVKRPLYKNGLDIMIDGGLTGNFPIHIFDSLVIGDHNNSLIANENTIGFRIDSDEQIESDKKNKELVKMPVTRFKEYTAAFYNMIIENLNRQSLSPADWKRTVSISDGEIGPRIRKLSKTEISKLIENGNSATKEFFRNK
ncbi:MAG: patatin-like phospholipase family protein [Chitinophagaceae bacterium]